LKKTIVLSATILSLFALAACSNSKTSGNQTKKESSSISSKKEEKSVSSSSKVPSSSKTSDIKTATAESMNNSTSSSQADSNKSQTVQTSSKTETNRNVNNQEPVSPYAVQLVQSQIPATFQFHGANVPKSIIINDINISSITFISKDNKSSDYNTSVETIPTKEIEIFSATDNHVRIVKVNTQINVSPISGATSNNIGPLYLIHNSQGGISLITPNYAGNVQSSQKDTMLEVIQ